MAGTAPGLRLQAATRPRFGRAQWPLLLALVLMLLPFGLSGYWTYSLGVCFANAIGVLAVTMLVRYGGEVSIGHSFFLAAGAYTVAMLDKHLGLPALVSLPLAVALGVVLGIAFAFPSRRLSGIYLAVTTMALALALPEIILLAGPAAGGFEGLYVAHDILPGVPKTLQQYYFALVLLFAAVAALARLHASRQGLALLTARSHPAAAEAFGIARDWARLSVMGISGGLAALSGAALAFTSSTVSPNSFTLWTSIFLLVGSVVSLYDLSLLGALVGGLFVTLMPQLLAGSGDWIPVLYGVALLAVILGARFVPALRKRAIP
jgi:branched-chain amino acid transport system permease protein